MKLTSLPTPIILIVHKLFLGHHGFLNNSVGRPVRLREVTSIFPIHKQVPLNTLWSSPVRWVILIAATNLIASRRHLLSGSKVWCNWWWLHIVYRVLIVHMRMVRHELSGMMLLLVGRKTMVEDGNLWIVSVMTCRRHRTRVGWTNRYWHRTGHTCYDRRSIRLRGMSCCRRSRLEFRLKFFGIRVQSGLLSNLALALTWLLALGSRLRRCLSLRLRLGL